MSNPKERKQILICDDEEGIRESLKLILGDHYDLTIAENGFACLDILNGNSDIALVLMDIKMPKVNGLDILQQIKDMHPEIKVIIVTGYKSVETASEATRRGASGYVVKPFESEEILEKVNAALNHSTTQN